MNSLIDMPAVVDVELLESAMISLFEGLDQVKVRRVNVELQRQDLSSNVQLRLRIFWTCRGDALQDS